MPIKVGLDTSFVLGVYDTVLELVEQSTGQLNFNDALIAIACQQRGISVLASFDSDFDQVPWLKRVAAPADLSA